MPVRSAQECYWAEKSNKNNWVFNTVLRSDGFSAYPVEKTSRTSYGNMMTATIVSKCMSFPIHAHMCPFSIFQPWAHPQAVSEHSHAQPRTVATQGQRALLRLTFGVRHFNGIGWVLFCIGAGCCYLHQRCGQDRPCRRQAPISVEVVLRCAFCTLDARHRALSSISSQRRRSDILPYLDTVGGTAVVHYFILDLMTFVFASTSPGSFSGVQSGGVIASDVHAMSDQSRAYGESLTVSRVDWLRRLWTEGGSQSHVCGISSHVHQQLHILFGQREVSL